MTHSDLPIGIFDSGVGGLTVMRQVQNLLPHESIIYFGDTARVPYGNKSPETIIRYAVECAQYLLSQNIKLLVVACNTVTSYALPILRELCYPIPVIGVISPGAEKAVSVTSTNTIAVLGTRATINSGAYQKEIKSLLPNATIFPIACPLFVPLAEELFLKHEATRLIIREYLTPLREYNHIDTILLGCTHYPLLSETIVEEIGENVTIVDSAATCAEYVKRSLLELNLNNKENNSNYRYIVSDDTHKFQLLGKNFLGMSMHSVECINEFCLTT